MNLKSHLTSLLCLCLYLASWASAAETIHFGANESPPYWSFSMDQQGMCGEILQALSAEAGLNAEVTFKPLKRLIEDAHNNDLGNPFFILRNKILLALFLSPYIKLRFITISRIIQTK